VAIIEDGAVVNGSGPPTTLSVYSYNKASYNRLLKLSNR